MFGPLMQGSGPLGLSRGVAARAWTDITGLRLWLKTDTLSALSSGDLVSSWSDSSGNGFTATSSGAARPEYRTDLAINGRPIVLIGDGTDVTANYLATSMTAASGSISAYLVCRPRHITLTSYFLDSETGRLILANGTNTGSSTGWYDGSWHAIAASTTNAQILEWILATGANAAKMYRNGAQIGSAATYTAKAIGGRVKIGGDYDVGGAPFYGDIGELLIYEGAHSDADRALLENYLNGRWATF